MPEVPQGDGPSRTPRPPVDKRRTDLKAVRTVFALEDGCLPEYAAPGGYEPRPDYLLEPAPDYLLLACPGCGRVSGMTVGDPKPAAKPSWRITGLPDAVTLEPSIDCRGCCGWHGFLTRGVYTVCKEG
jgi:hypothetical protein